MEATITAMLSSTSLVYEGPKPSRPAEEEAEDTMMGSSQQPPAPHTGPLGSTARPPRAGDGDTNCEVEPEHPLHWDELRHMEWWDNPPTSLHQTAAPTISEIPGGLRTAYAEVREKVAGSIVQATSDREALRAWWPFIYFDHLLLGCLKQDPEGEILPVKDRIRRRIDLFGQGNGTF